MPSGILFGFHLYRTFLSPEHHIPLGFQIGVALLCGFLGPRGGWKWAILIGLGVPAGDWLAHLIDRTIPSPINSVGAPVVMARSFFPTLFAVYAGRFLHTRIWGALTDEEEKPISAKDQQVAMERFLNQYEKIKEERGSEEAKMASEAFIHLQKGQTETTSPQTSPPHPAPTVAPSPQKVLTTSPSSIPQPAEENASTEETDLSQSKGPDHPPEKREDSETTIANSPQSEDEKLKRLEQRLGLGYKRGE